MNTNIYLVKALRTCVLLVCFCIHPILSLAQPSSMQDIYKQALHLEKQNHYAQALALYTSLAEQDHANAQFKVGAYYAAGAGTNKDFTKAIFWFRKAVAQGQMDAMVALGDRYYRGEGVFEVKKKAFELYLRAAKLGHTLGQLYTGTLYHNNELYMRDITQAIFWYTKAAEQGSQKAMMLLGDIYLTGDGVKKDQAVALKIFTMAAERGFMEAQEKLGDLYQPKFKHGMDAKQALALFSHPSKPDDPFMKFSQAEAKRKGISIEEYFEQQFGDYDGIANDFDTSVMWYALAQKQGSEHAKKMLQSLKVNYGKGDWEAYVERQAQKMMSKALDVPPKNQK